MERVNHCSPSLQTSFYIVSIQHTQFKQTLRKAHYTRKYTEVCTTLHTLVDLSSQFRLHVNSRSIRSSSGNHSTGDWWPQTTKCASSLLNSRGPFRAPVVTFWPTVQRNKSYICKQAQASQQRWKNKGVKVEARNQRLTNSWEGEKVYTCVHTVYSVGAGEGGKCGEGPREHCKHKTKS